ncbi:hypothetical protein [Polyangium mundeleinium]|uniref:Uncharacterized protein n=1 Tax=Polyangium mundeleinium TaxID=2995306 RepID=A0ABT5EY01_9BACT|nr:hypothetical protein [Polyangium mundeleinium]MDC0746671.1 hypothetical protein [Polyangium mundeleinium]
MLAQWGDLTPTFIDEAVQVAYAAQHERSYKIPVGLPASRRWAYLTTDQQSDLRQNLQWLAASRQAADEAAGEALHRTAVDVMTVWFANPGRDNWLRIRKHPLARLCEDFADVATSILGRDKAKASGVVPKPAFVPTLRERSQGEQEQVKAGLQGVLAVLKRPAAKGAAA